MPDHKLTDADYKDLADSYEANPPGLDEVIGEPILGPGHLPTGRPPKGRERGGKTPSTTVRLPATIRAELDRRATESTPASEIIRAALVEYFENHPKAG